MSALQEAIFKALKDDTAIASKVSAGGGKFHIYPIKIPRKALALKADYYITFGQISSLPNLKFIDVQLPLFQINAIAKEYSDAVALKSDIVSLLERFKGDLALLRKIKYTYIVNDFETRDPDNDLFYFPIEVRFKYFGDNV
jgi:hypothetical protein